MSRYLPLARFSLPLLLLAVAAPARAGDLVGILDTGFGIVFKNNDSTIERFRIDEDSGNISRNGALFIHTTGTASTFVGVDAGNTTTTGYGNSAFALTPHRVWSAIQQAAIEKSGGAA